MFKLNYYEQVNLNIQILTTLKESQNRLLEASGLDLKAGIQNDIIIKKDYLLLTGIVIEIPKGYEAQVRPRSGLAANYNCPTPGTIDSDYRGELKVILINLEKRLFGKPHENSTTILAHLIGKNKLCKKYLKQY